MKILFWDIETLPGVFLSFQAKTDWLPAVFMLKPPIMLGYAAKFEGERTMYSGILTPAEVEARDDSRVVQEMADLLADVDYAVAHNGDRFDLPMLNGFVAADGLAPIRWPQTIDTLKVAKSSMRRTYNNLDQLAKDLGVPQKIKTDAQLWVDCFHGDEKALAKMHRYNRQDVKVLEAVYHRLTPHAKRLPRLVDADFDGQLICDRCKSDDIHKDGIARKPVNNYQRYRCQDCGHCFQGDRPIKGAKLASRRLAA